MEFTFQLLFSSSARTCSTLANLISLLTKETIGIPVKPIFCFNRPFVPVISGVTNGLGLDFIFTRFIGGDR